MGVRQTLYGSELQLRVAGREYLVAGVAYWLPEVGATRSEPNGRTAVLRTEYLVSSTAVRICSRDLDRYFWGLGCHSRYQVPATHY